jgi:hypothetical protein
MSRRRAWLVTAATILAFAALAIEPPQTPPGDPAKPEPAEREPAQQEPASTPAPTPVPTPAPGAEAGDESAPSQEPAAEDDELPPLPPDAAPAGPPPQRFNPTEKVRADFPVSFPIDI